MRRKLGLPVLLLVGAACSVLNSPEELKPANEGEGPKAGSTSAGSANGGSTGGGGKEAQGGTPEAPGGVSNNGGCADDCLPGGAPPVGKSCADSAEDCGSTAPICDDASGECRACATNDECEAAVGKPFCVDSGVAEGLCASCRADTDCEGTKPVCGAAGECRACNIDNECASGVCNMNGACADPTQVVYALAQTGVTSDACGSQDEPCRNLSDAVAKMTETRRTLVLVKTPKAFDGGAATFPAIKGLRVVGNGVAAKPFGASAFIVPVGAAVQLEDVLIRGVTDQDVGAVTCSGGTLSVTRSTFEDNAVAILARDCELSVTQSSFLRNGAPTASSSGALRISSCGASCTKKAIVLRSRFVDNAVAISAWDQGQVTIENNVFWRNGADGYTRVIELRSLAARFAYNTLVENFNGCTYVGIVACDDNCQNVANISFNNFPGQDCLDQVWYGGKLSYNLTEVAYPGVTNKVGDPRFADAANGDFTPQSGSPAIDAGNPSDAPPLDFFGTKRPVGDAPDIGAIEAK